MPSRLPWPSSYLSFLTRFISRRADRRSSPGLGERVREGKGAGVVEPSSPCSSLMWQSHTQPDFRTFRSAARGRRTLVLSIDAAPQLLGAITLAILLASLLVWRRSRRRLVRDRSARDVTPSGGRPDVLSSR